MPISRWPFKLSVVVLIPSLVLNPSLVWFRFHHWYGGSGTDTGTDANSVPVLAWYRLRKLGIVILFYEKTHCSTYFKIAAL